MSHGTREFPLPLNAVHICSLILQVSGEIRVKVRFIRAQEPESNRPPAQPKEFSDIRVPVGTIRREPWFHDL